MCTSPKRRTFIMNPFGKPVGNQQMALWESKDSLLLLKMPFIFKKFFVVSQLDAKYYQNKHSVYSLVTSALTYMLHMYVHPPNARFLKFCETCNDTLEQTIHRFHGSYWPNKNFSQFVVEPACTPALVERSGSWALLTHNV